MNVLPEIQAQYDVIAAAHERLRELRAACPHVSDKLEEVGLALMCERCGQILDSAVDLQHLGSATPGAYGIPMPALF